MQEQGRQMPKWWYQKRRPKSDNVYFENMRRVIFQAGLNWQVVDKKWPSLKEAFCNFNIQEVAAFTDADLARLLKDGSFQKYLDNMDKSENYSKVIKVLINNFKWLGAPSAGVFLYTVGEDINVWGHE